jgi:hypothetical protein
MTVGHGIGPWRLIGRRAEIDVNPISYMRAVGHELYGERWVSALARDLGVALRTVQRWNDGAYEPSDPARLIADLRALVIARRDHLDKLARRATEA